MTNTCLDDFEIMECIDDEIAASLGNIRFTLYWRLYILHSVPKGGILENPDAFVHELHTVFGAGANALEQRIVSRVREKAGLGASESSSLSGIIHDARRTREAQYQIVVA